MQGTSVVPWERRMIVKELIPLQGNIPKAFPTDQATFRDGTQLAWRMKIYHRDLNCDGISLAGFGFPKPFESDFLWNKVRMEG